MSSGCGKDNDTNTNNNIYYSGGYGDGRSTATTSLQHLFRQRSSDDGGGSVQLKRNKETPAPSSTTKTEPLYHPSIVRFTCHGAFSVSSSRPFSDGACTGFKSQMEDIDRWRLVTRDEAVSVFCQQAASSTSSSSTSSSPSPPSPTGGTTGSFPGADDAATAHALQVAVATPVLVYPPNRDGNNKGNKKSKPKTALTHRPQASTTPASQNGTPSTTNELDGKHQDWSCYGTSEVDLLVLRSEGGTEETVAAVAPYCSPGVSIRDTKSKFWKDRNLTVRLGYYEFVYQTILDLDKADLFPKRTQTSRRSKSMEHTKQQLPHSDDASSAIQANPGDQDITKKMLEFPSKIVHQMKVNANIIKGAVEEEFPSRTYAAGKRIIGQFGATMDRTLQLMGKVSNSIAGIITGQDDEDNRKGRGGGGR